jgi:hypothetical protein
MIHLLIEIYHGLALRAVRKKTKPGLEGAGCRYVPTSIPRLGRQLRPRQNRSQRRA